MTEPTVLGGAGGAVDRATQLDRLLAPRTVAVVGASPRAGGWGLTTIENLDAIGFTGAVFPVNPRYDAVAGRQCVATLADLPVVPDVAVVAVNAGLVADSISAAAAVGVPAAVVFASGFGASGQGEGGDAGEHGPRARLLAATADRRIAVLGPNCLGAVNYARRCALWGITLPFAHAGDDSGVALIAQSGNMALTLAGVNRGFPITHLVSCGNQLDVSVAALMGACLRDPAVRVIAAVVEGVPDIEEFRAVLADAADRDIPVVVLKVGQSAKGQAATVAHTGTLSGAPALYRALFRQYGVIQVDDLDELASVLALLGGPRRSAARGVAFFASSGGECGLISDLAETHGVRLPDFQPEVAATIQALIPDYGRVSNPLDFTAGGWGNAALYTSIITALGDVEELDTIIGVHDAPTLEGDELEDHWAGIVKGLGDGAQRLGDEGPPVANLSTVGDVRSSVPKALLQAGLVPLVGLRPTLSALGKIGARTAWLDGRRAAPAADGDGPDPAAATAMLAELPPGPVAEDVAKAVLRAVGIATPAGRVVRSAGEAMSIAEGLGYPLVAKVCSAQIVHKSDIGGVRAGLRDDVELGQAVDQLLRLLPAQAAEAGGVLVEELVAGTPELIVGARRDPDFGPVVMVGLGGVVTELYRDVAHRLAPVSSRQAMAMIDELGAARLLDGFRGAPVVDRRRLADLLVAVSTLVSADNRIAELDMNPVVWDADTGRLVALDALIVAAPG